MTCQKFLEDMQDQGYNLNMLKANSKVEESEMDRWIRIWTSLRDVWISRLRFIILIIACLTEQMTYKKW